MEKLFMVEVAVFVGEVAVLRTGSKFAVEPTCYTEDGAIVYRSKELATGFCVAEQTTLNGEIVDAYYVVDMDNTNLGAMLFVLEKVTEPEVLVYKKLNVGQTVGIQAQGMLVKGEVLSASHYGTDGWYIELGKANVGGGYSYWKQGQDGGQLVVIDNKILLDGDKEDWNSSSDTFKAVR